MVLNKNDQKAVQEMIRGHQKDLPVYDFTETKNKIVKEVHEYILKLAEVHFEKLIASYLTFIGADTVKIPSKNSKSASNGIITDIDVKAAFTNLDICVFVQAKRHESKSSNFGIRQLLAYQTKEDEEPRNLQTLKWYITTAKIDDETVMSAQNGYEEKVRVLQDRAFVSLLVDSGFIYSNDVFSN